MHRKGKTLEVSLACLTRPNYVQGTPRESNEGLTSSARSSAAYGYSLVWHCTSPRPVLQVELPGLYCLPYKPCLYRGETHPFGSLRKGRRSGTDTRAMPVRTADKWIGKVANLRGRPKLSRSYSLRPQKPMPQQL